VTLSLLGADFARLDSVAGVQAALAA
jgi:hypothetical protein